MKPLNILVIDDEHVIRAGCRMVLGERGHAVESRGTCREGIDAIMAETFDVILLDMKLPDMDGTEVLKTVRDKRPEQRVVVMSGYATVKNIMNSGKLGAFDYLPKPFTDDELVAAVERTTVR